MSTNITKSMAKVIAKVSYKEAEKNANSACAFIHGQPKMPESVKSLKKKNA